MTQKSLLLLTLAAPVLGLTASAAVYSDRLAFLTATSATFTTGFEEFVAPGDVQYPPGSTLVVNSNLTVSAPANLTLWGAGVLTPSAVIDADGFSTSLTLSFALGTDSVGLDYGTMHNASPAITIEVYDAVLGGTLLYSSGAFAAPFIIEEPFNFFGIDGVGNIGRVVISGGHAITADNIYMPAAVPEPSTYAALVATAALGFAGSRRRRAG